MFNKYKFVAIMEGEFCSNIINVNVVSQCHHTVLDVFRRLTFISGKSTKRGVNYW
jgi:hypothetical protein